MPIMNRAYRSDTAHGMSCRHGSEHHCRLKAGAGVLVGDVAGQWTCDVCHTPAKPLVEHGLIEWRDGRETLPLRLMGPLAIRKGQLRLDRPVASGSASSEAKEPGPREQVTSGSVGSDEAVAPRTGRIPPSEEPVKVTAPTPKPSVKSNDKKSTKAKAKPAPPPALF